MADTITNATRENLDGGACHCYHIAYDVEDGGDKNSFCVVVKAEDMTDPDDEAEAKTLANAVATTMKADWVTAKATANSNVNEPTIEGAVTL